MLVLCFLVGFCLCFCFDFWRFAPETVWKNSLDVRSVVFWVRSLFLWVFVVIVFRFCFWLLFLFFKRQRSGSSRTPPHAPFCLFLFSFCVPPRVLFHPFWPCVPLLRIFLGVPFWAPRVLGFSWNLWGLSSLAPSEALFLGREAARVLLCFSCLVFLFPLLFCFAATLFLENPSRCSHRSG